MQSSGTFERFCGPGQVDPACAVSPGIDRGGDPEPGEPAVANAHVSRRRPDWTAVRSATATLMKIGPYG